MLKKLNILLIEDDLIEVMKFKKVIKTLQLNHNVIESNNGSEALEILKYSTPDLIILDLNMPILNGIDFLKLLKKEDKLRYIPVVILTTSRNDNDLLECYKIGIAGYLLKPLKYEQYTEVLKNTLAYWSINELKFK